MAFFACSAALSSSSVSACILVNLARQFLQPLVLLKQRHGGWPRCLDDHGDLRREERLRLTEILVKTELPWDGDEGYRKAEVTGGGVSLAELDPRTLESRRHPGLFICGEVLDAFGPVGGYNFLWAWATGRAAGSAAGRTT